MTENFRYLVIEGPIGVGKTSLAKKLAAEFGSELLLEQAQENPFLANLANFYHNPRQYALSAQLHFLLQRAQQVQDFRQSDLFRGSYIADFMVDKDRLFAQMTLNPDELALYEQIYTHLTLDAPRPDLVIYLQAPVEVLRERIVRRGIDYEQQIRDEYLLRLSESYTRFFYDYDDSALLKHPVGRPDQ
jgi:deoxyadenosine/deoxycytidine kinase